MASSKLFKCNANRLKSWRIDIYRKGNKRKSFIRCRMSLKHIALTRPNVYTSGDILVIDNHLDIKENKESIVKALKNEARKLYPEFKEENIYIKL